MGALYLSEVFPRLYSYDKAVLCNVKNNIFYFKISFHSEFSSIAYLFQKTMGVAVVFSEPGKKELTQGHVHFELYGVCLCKLQLLQCIEVITNHPSIRKAFRSGSLSQVW